MQGAARCDLHLVSTGRVAQAKLQRQLYAVDSDAKVRDKFLAALDRVPTARAVIPRGARKTTTLAARYLRETINATLRIDL